MTSHVLERRRVARIVAQNPDLRAIAIRLKALHEDRQVTVAQVNLVIQRMHLPIRQHLFVTGNYSTLVTLDYSS